MDIRHACPQLLVDTHDPIEAMNKGGLLFETSTIAPDKIKKEFDNLSASSNDFQVVYDPMRFLFYLLLDFYYGNE